MAKNYLSGRPGAALVIGTFRNGATEIRGFGRIETTGRPPDGRTFYELGSITKPFTAILLARMVESGLFSLDDPVARWLPCESTFANKYGRPVTLLHLANHTSGLPKMPDNFPRILPPPDNPYSTYSAEDLYAYLAKALPAQEPGVKYEYSNVAYGLLGHLLSLRSGKPYGELVAEQVCAPLGLRDTRLELDADQAARLAPGHHRTGRRVGGWTLDAMAGAGGLRSTANDLLQFARANLSPGNSALGSAMIRCQQPTITNGSRACGLGWQITTPEGGGTVLWHNGGTGGYSTFLGLERAAQTAAVVLSNYADAMEGEYEVDSLGQALLAQMRR